MAGEGPARAGGSQKRGVSSCGPRISKKATVGKSKFCGSTILVLWSEQNGGTMKTASIF
jgi:hypothetical protein